MADAKGTRKRARSEKVSAVIDRVEDGDIAVVMLDDEAQSQLDLHISHLPEGTRDEGAHLLLTFEINPADETRKLKKIEPAPARRAQAESRVKNLHERLERLSGAQGKKDFKL
ncbi:MAG: DUF3006 domain-containing protein [Pyrinomonadaceae bacterium]